MDEDNARRVALGGSVRSVVVGRAAVVCCPKEVEPIYFLEKNDLSPSYDLRFWNRLHHCILCDEGNKTRSHLHIFWWCFSLVPSCYMLSHKLSRCLHITCRTCKVRVATKNSIFCVSCQEIKKFTMKSYFVMHRSCHKDQKKCHAHEL